MRRQAAALIFGFALHHSLAGVYDTTREISVQGVITEFRFVNHTRSCSSMSSINPGSWRWTTFQSLSISA